VFGVFAPDEDVARITFYGIYALQHRGQESAGIATGDGRGIHLRTGMGLVSQVFDENDLPFLPGFVAIAQRTPSRCTWRVSTGRWRWDITAT